MGLERIDHAIYAAGRDTGLEHRMRTIYLGRLGIPEARITTTNQDRLLTDSTQTAAVLSDRLDESPDSLNLVVFSGRVDDGWHALVKRAYEAVLRKAGDDQLEAHLAGLDHIFERIGAVRSQFTKGREFDPKRAVTQLLGTVPKLPPELSRAVQARVMLIMFSDGEKFVREGQVAAELGVIDGAFPTLKTVQDPGHAIAHLEERLRHRGL